MGDGYTSIVLGNDPVPLKLQRIFLLRLCEGVTKRKLKKILVLPLPQQKISQVGFVRFTVKRLEAPGLNCFFVIKTSFQESEHDDDRFRFKRMSTSPHGSEAR